MHIPDGLLDAKTFGTAWAIGGVFMAFAVAKTNKELKERQIPFMGVMAAFIFAAQMINLPIGVGVSGHLLGGVMAAVLLGPLVSVHYHDDRSCVTGICFSGWWCHCLRRKYSQHGCNRSFCRLWHLFVVP
jgi:hypothetical protein